jgi:hypothetical protein
MLNPIRKKKKIVNITKGTMNVANRPIVPGPLYAAKDTATKVRIMVAHIGVPERTAMLIKITASDVQAIKQNRKRATNRRDTALPKNFPRVISNISFNLNPLNMFMRNRVGKLIAKI